MLKLLETKLELGIPFSKSEMRFFGGHRDFKRNILKKLEAALYTLRLPDELDLEKFNYDLDEIIITPDE